MCKRPCKVLFCTVNCTIYRVEFKIGSEIMSLLEIVRMFTSVVTILLY
jgi:hypothetical protein